MAKAGIGRPRKPAKVAELEGYRKDRVVTNTPVPADNVPVAAPPDLSPAAQREWERLAPDLIAKGVLTGWDTQAFGHYCAVIVRLWEASARIEDEGMVVEVPNVSKTNGKVMGVTKKVNPWMQVYKELSQDAARWASRFGLTPTDRASLSLDGNAGKTEPGADLLSG